MNKKIKVRYLEDFGKRKKGEETIMSKKDAIAIIKENICEYVKEEKPKKIIKKKPKPTKKKEEFKEFGEMITEDLLKTGFTDEEGNIVLKGVKDKVKIGKIKEGMSDNQIKQLLEKRKLWDYIIDEIGKKHVGDIEAREIVFLSALGRLVKNKKPFSFNIIVHSISSAGKDHLVESVLRLFPQEDIEAFGRISKTSLTYFHDIKKEPFFSYDGKVLYLEEITEEILNNEVMKVFTAGLTKSLITKDQEAQVMQVQGKPVVICTTATTTPTPEILNRFSIVKLDESEEQTKRTYAHEEEDYNESIINFLFLMKPMKVNIPLTMRKKIANSFPANKTSMRRAFPRFLDIVRAVAIFHNEVIFDEKAYKKQVSIEAKWEDYDLAVRIFRNYRSGVSSIPLKNDDKKIVEILEDSISPLDAKEITRKMEGVLSSVSIYKRLDNLKENEIIECFSVRDNFNNQVKQYQISEEFKDKNPIALLDSFELK